MFLPMKTVLFLLDQYCEPISRKIEGLHRAALPLGWHVIPVPLDRFKGQVAACLDKISPDGCIVDCSQLTHTLDRRPFRKYPTVYVDSDPAVLPPGATTVNVDTRQVVDLAIAELAPLAPQCWAFVGYGLTKHWSRNRAALFQETCRANGSNVHTYLRPWLNLNLAEAQQDIGRWIAALPRPCALFAANDETASTVHAACLNQNLSIPQDIAIVSTDNDYFLCENLRPTISSVGLDFIQCGQLAIEMMKRRLGGEPTPPVVTYGTSGVFRRQSTTRVACADRQIARLVELIRKEACHKLTAADVIARETGSRRALEMRFRQATGQSIHEMILATRLEQVKNLLRRPHMAIGPIANMCGWDSEAHLKRYFKQQTGQTMKAWRAQHSQA